MENLIQTLRNRLDFIEEDSQFDSELLAEMKLLLEASKLIKSLGNWEESLKKYKDKQGAKLAQYLHKEYNVSDQAELVRYKHPTSNLDLMTFKTHYDNFTLLHGPNGWAAFKPKESYLKTKLETPEYDPSTDKNIEYIGIFSLEQPSENSDGRTFFTQTIVGTRGGSYSKREKKVQNKVTGEWIQLTSVADKLKEHIGFKGVEAYRLMERDSEEFKNMPDETDQETSPRTKELMDKRRLAGKRSASFPGSSYYDQKKLLPPSVQRVKMDYRRPSETSTVKKLLPIVVNNFKPIRNKLLKRVELLLRRAGDENNKTVETLQNQPDKFETVYWPKIVERAVERLTKQTNFGDKIENWYQKNPGSKLKDQEITLKLIMGDSFKLTKQELLIFKSLIKIFRSTRQRKLDNKLDEGNGNTYLREYSREKAIQALGDKFLKKYSNNPDELEYLFDRLEKLDPTQNKQYTRWLAVQYTRGQIDLQDRKISEVLYAFHKFKPKFQEKDIRKYNYKSLEAAVEKILNPSVGDNVDLEKLNVESNENLKVQNYFDNLKGMISAASYILMALDDAPNNFNTIPMPKQQGEDPDVKINSKIKELGEQILQILSDAELQLVLNTLKKFNNLSQRNSKKGSLAADAEPLLPPGFNFSEFKEVTDRKLKEINSLVATLINTIQQQMKSEDTTVLPLFLNALKEVFLQTAKNNDFNL